MNNRFIPGSLVVMLFGFVLGTAPAARAEQETTAMPAGSPSAVTEMDGRVVSVDLKNHRLRVEDTHKQPVTLQITQATVISNSGSSKLVLKNVKANDKIHAYYTTADKKAIQIDVSPGLPIMHDLETHK